MNKNNMWDRRIDASKFPNREKKDIKVFDIQIPTEVQNEKNMLAYNREIVVMLADLVEEHPDWRFQQLLQNVGIIHKVMENGVPKIVDSYYEPSAETLFNLKDIINRL